MTPVTGMLIVGKMSIGTVTMDSTPMTAINTAITTMVYGPAECKSNNPQSVVPATALR